MCQGKWRNVPDIFRVAVGVEATDTGLGAEGPRAEERAGSDFEFTASFLFIKLWMQQIQNNTKKKFTDS